MLLFLKGLTSPSSGWAVTGQCEGMTSVRIHSSRVFSLGSSDSLGPSPTCSTELRHRASRATEDTGLWRSSQTATGFSQRSLLFQAGRAALGYLLLSLISFVGMKDRSPEKASALEPIIPSLLWACRQEAQPLLLSAPHN